MSVIKLKMNPISSADFQFNNNNQLDPQGDILNIGDNIDNVQDHLKEFRSVMGIAQAIKRIIKTIQATGLTEERSQLLENKARKLANLSDTQIYPIFKNTAEALVSAGYTKSQSLNKAREVAFKALQESLKTLNITDPDLYPRAALSTQIKDPQTVQDLSKFINII